MVFVFLGNLMNMENESQYDEHKDSRENLVKRSSVRRRLQTLVVVLLIASFGLGTFYGGYSLGFTRGESAALPKSKELIGADFSLFWKAVETVKNSYVRAGDVKDQDLMYGAISGMVSSLKDPYTLFFKPDDAERFQQDINGSFGGIGAEIGIHDSQLVIIAPLKGNPAEKAGLKAGDKILKVNEEATSALTVEEAVKIIRGEPGTEVKLLIYRDGWKEAREFAVTRAVIHLPTLDWEMKPGNIGYFHLYNFNAELPSAFYEGVLSALVRGMEGVIVDLRDNPGGYLEVANVMAGWFLKKGEIIVRERFAQGEDNIFRANGNSALNEMPIVVLVNGGSASASEILAGALRDIRGIKIIGEKTFGKGTVQNIIDLDDKSMIKVSVAEWLTPNGTSIDKQGIMPDIEIKNATSSDSEMKEEKKKDVQLEEAVRVLKEEMIRVQNTRSRLIVL